MARKWFQLVDVDGSAVTSAASTYVDIEDVDSLLDAVKKEYNDSYLAGIAAPDLTVFANRAAYDGHQKLPKASSSLAALGTDEDSPLIVQVPVRRRVDTDEQPPHKKARSSTVIEDEIIESIGHNLNIDAWHVGGIDLSIHKVESDFPEWFYVRKEALDIVKVFKAQMGARRNVVFVGTPGVGKSMLVVLFAFYMALIEKKRVVLFRKLKAVQPVGFSMLYLDAQSDPPVFWRMARAAISDIDRVENQNFELCLDGLPHKEVYDHFGTLGRFRLLATSAQYQMKDDDVHLRQCLVPFWSLSDLKVIGTHRKWSEQEIKDRYFYSGGNLRAFSSPKDGLKISTNQAIRVVDLDIATLLNTRYEGGAESHVDRLRMTGIKASGQSDLARDTNAYLDCSKWICVITSEYALRELSNIVKPSYYEELWRKASMLGDDGLKGIAFENYVHTLARDGKTIKLRVRPYDRVKVKQHTYEDLDIEPARYSNDGNDAAECDAAMKQFACSSDDYWYPSCHSLETIDSVAKLKIDGQSKVVGLIQITKSDKHTIDSKAINKYAGFFPNGCRYMALVLDMKTCDKFRLDPVSPDTEVPLDVAHFKEFPQSNTL
ncbi:hypothetical protein V7S43_002187 [Phytophthora oleae]|uniref:Crinkler (CRN) family protein n=1 Tax=Phytophthora oleae TaxID=2107226 RepID=A0ABD3G161_9STRA